MEDIETQERRDPGDVDVVTFAAEPVDLNALAAIMNGDTSLWYPPMSKATYSVDHYIVPIGSQFHEIVDQCRYWCGLFSHRRDGLWKGMLRLPLTIAADDAAARTALGGTP